MLPIVLTYMEKIVEYDEEGLAKSFEIFESSKNEKVIINPNLNFGQPMVLSVNMAVHSLSESVNLFGGINEAAQELDVTANAVSAAVEFRDRYGIAA